MASIVDNVLQRLVDILFSAPEPWGWLIMGIFLVVCGTERIAATSYVDYLLSRQNRKCTSLKNTIAHGRAVPAAHH